MENNNNDLKKELSIADLAKDASEIEKEGKINLRTKGKELASNFIKKQDEILHAQQDEEFQKIDLENNEQINGKSIEIITEEYNTMLYYVTVKGVKTLRKTTTGSFIKKYPVGTYIVVVNRHAFTIKDGVVIGNLADGKQMKKHINGAWKIK